MRSSEYPSVKEDKAKLPMPTKLSAQCLLPIQATTACWHDLSMELMEQFDHLSCSSNLIVARSPWICARRSWRRRICKSFCVNAFNSQWVIFITSAARRSTPMIKQAPIPSCIIFKHHDICLYTNHDWRLYSPEHKQWANHQLRNQSFSIFSPRSAKRQHWYVSEKVRWSCRTHLKR